MVLLCRGYVVLKFDHKSSAQRLSESCEKGTLYIHKMAVQVRRGLEGGGGGELRFS